MSSAAKKVFLSHCVRTSGERATTLYKLLEENGLSTFLCSKIDMGDSFRTEIVFNISNCLVCVVFLDPAWVESKECKDEFQTCQSANRTVIYLPIVKGGLGWIKKEERSHACAVLLTANYQCKILKNDSDEEWQKAFEEIKDRCKCKILEERLRQENQEGNENDMQSLIDAVLVAKATCELCGNIFEDPKLLKCSHTFCLKCLKDEVRENEKDLQCPKCKIECGNIVNDLPSNETFSNIINNNATILSRDSSGYVANCEEHLKSWFQKYSIPEEVQRALIEEAFDTLELVLEMSQEDMAKLKLKSGHIKKLQMSISKHKSYLSSGKTDGMLDNSTQWSILDEHFDERSLKTGTVPTDATKFWASLSEKVRECIAQKVENTGEEVYKDESLPLDVKTELLYKVAMILCDIGMYGKSEQYAEKSLKVGSSSATVYSVRLLQIFAKFNRLREGLFIQAGSETGWRSFLTDCSEVMKVKTSLQKEMMVKLLNLYLFGIQTLALREQKFRPEAKTLSEPLISEITKLCNEFKLDSLYAECLANQGLLMKALNPKDKKSAVKKLLQSRKICKSMYGEFNTLMARLYYNLGDIFESMRDNETAYECFRRSWLVYRQVYGDHHPQTVKAAKVISNEGEFVKIGEKKKDCLPNPQFFYIGITDIDFETRLKVLDKYEEM